MNTIFTQIKLMNKPYAQQMQKLLEPFHVTELQWGLLRYLYEINPATFSEVAVYWRVEKPSVTPVGQKLIELGLIEVLPGTDKRQKVMHLTKAGQEKYFVCKEAVDAYQTQLLHDISYDQLKVVQEVLNQISSNMMKRGSL